MKKLTDEEIQSMLEEEAVLPENDADASLYKALFSELKNEPPGELPFSFSADVVRKIRTAQNRKNDRKIYITCAILVLTGLAGIFLQLDKDIMMTAWAYLSGQPGVWLFMAVAITMPLLFERKKLPMLRNK
jgi:hypothetical protein